jgi:mono/diheme cytochrome c family protein
MVAASYRNNSLLLACSSAFVFLVGIQCAQADVSRGQALYENHCTTCHNENIHLRTPPRVTSRDELKGWVASWSIHENLEWSGEDINDVTRYLSESVYGFTQ